MPRVSNSVGTAWLVASYVYSCGGEARLFFCQYSANSYLVPTALFQQARTMRAVLPLTPFSPLSLELNLSLVQDMYQEYMALSESYLSSSVEQGFAGILPVVSAAFRRVVILV